MKRHYGFESSSRVNNAINANFFSEIFIDAQAKVLGDAENELRVLFS